jgi:hypothetical protein
VETPHVPSLKPYLPLLLTQVRKTESGIQMLCSPQTPGYYAFPACIPSLAVRLLTQSDHIQLCHAVSPGLPGLDDHPGFLRYSGVTGNPVITCVARQSPIVWQGASGYLVGSWANSPMCSGVRTDPAVPRPGPGPEPAEARSPRADRLRALSYSGLCTALHVGIGWSMRGYERLSWTKRQCE